MSNENIDPKSFPTNKKRKRISFSKNLMLQELLSDGSTRIFEEKINDDENCSLVSMAIDDSDSIFNKTVYDTNEMELSLLSPTPLQLSQQLSPPTRSPLTQSPSFSQRQSTTPLPKSLIQAAIPGDIDEAVQLSKNTAVPQIENTPKEQTPQKAPEHSTQQTPTSSFVPQAISLVAQSPLPSFSQIHSTTPLSKSLIHSSIPKDDTVPQNENTLKEQTPQKAPDQSTQQTPTSSFSPQASSLVAQSPSPLFSLRQSTTPLSKSLIHSSIPKDIVDTVPQIENTPKEQTPQKAPDQSTQQTPTSSFSPQALSLVAQSPSPFSLRQSTTPLSKSLINSSIPKDIVDTVPQIENTPKEQTPQKAPEHSPQQTPTSSFSARALSLVAQSPSPLFSLRQSTTPLSKSLINSSIPKDIVDTVPQIENTPKEQTPQKTSELSTQQTPTSSFSPQALSLVAQSPSPSFSLRQSTTPLSPSLSPTAIQQDIGDTFYDSVLIYVDEKSVLQLSCDDSTPEQSMIQYQQSTTFAADLLNDDSIEVDEEEEVDNTLNFIDNRAPSPVRKMLNSASIDSRLWSFISEINEDYTLLTFLGGNFQVLIKFDLQDEDNLEVIINEISLQSLIDQNIKAKGWTRISDEVVHLLTKPRDAKLIKVIKNVAEARFEKFKQDIATPAMLNDVLKGLCKIFNRLEALTVELAELSLGHEWKIINADINSFEIALETYGLRYTLWLVLCLDLTTYPDYPCKIKFGVHKADLKLYPYHLLNRAAKNVSPGDSDYLRSIMRATKKFIFDYRRKHSIKSVRISFHHSHY